MRTKRINEEVLYAEEEVVKISGGDIALLKEQSDRNSRKRIRVCAHKDVDDSLHEMFIVHTNDTYVRPHKHLNKSEALHVIEGSVTMVIFDDAGNVVEASFLGDYASGKQFYHRISEPRYHTLLITSDVLVFHEVTGGPFDEADTIWAPWAPERDDTIGGKAFMEKLAVSADRLLAEDHSR